MADNLLIKDGNLADRTIQTTDESNLHLPHHLVKGGASDFSPYYNGVTSLTKREATVDPDGNLNIRGAVHTDELSTRVNFANSSLAATLGSCSVAANSNIVTGSGFLSLVIDKGDYFKFDADGEAFLNQVDSIDSDTQITLVSNYDITARTNAAASRWIMKTVTGSGDTITVSNGQCIITSGTTANTVSEVKRLVDYSPVNLLIGVSVSQRIANQDIFIGFRDPLSTIKYFQWFRLTGTTNTVVDIQSGYNPTTAPSAAETVSVTSISLPNGLTTASIVSYRVETSFDRVRFYARAASTTDGGTEILLGEIVRVAPHPNDPLEIVVRKVNGATPPASSTTIAIDFLYAKNFNKLQVEQSGNQEGFIALAAPSQSLTGSASANNTDLLVINMAQLRAGYITISGTFSATVSIQGSNTPDFATPVNLTAYNMTGGTLVSTVTAAAVLAIGKETLFIRIRTTAWASGTPVALFIGDQNPPSWILKLINANQSGTWTVQPGNTPNTAAWLVANRAESTATGALSKLRVLAAATTNSNLVKGSAGRVYFIKAFNTSASTKFLKMYNKATAPTVGTDAVVETYPLAVGYTPIDFADLGDSFTTGIGLGITGAIGDADTTALAANDVVLNVFFL